MVQIHSKIVALFWNIKQFCVYEMYFRIITRWKKSPKKIKTLEISFEFNACEQL